MVAQMEYHVDESQTDKQQVAEMKKVLDERQREISNLVKLCNELREKQKSNEAELTGVYDSLNRKENVTKDLETRLSSKLNEVREEKEETAKELELLKRDYSS